MRVSLKIRCTVGLFGCLQFSYPSLSYYGLMVDPFLPCLARFNIWGCFPHEPFWLAQNSFPLSAYIFLNYDRSFVIIDAHVLERERGIITNT